MQTTAYIGFIVIAYLIGAIPFGLLIGKFYGIDVRKVGSGNVGATNVTRAVGKWAGRFCFLCDFLKGAIPTILAQYWFQDAPMLWIMAAAAAVIGHIAPVFLKFKGGKGISTAAGAAIALAPLPLLCAAAAWVITFYASGFVSLASIIAATVLPCSALIFMLFNMGNPAAQSGKVVTFMFFAGALAILRHHSNIKRLLNGTESSFKKHKHGE